MQGQESFEERNLPQILLKDFNHKKIKKNTVPVYNRCMREDKSNWF